MHEQTDHRAHGMVDEWRRPVAKLGHEFDDVLRVALERAVPLPVVSA